MRNLLAGVCLASFAGFAAAAYAAADSPSAPLLHMNDLGKGTAPLDGPWQFHTGDNPAWAQPSINDATGQGGWEQLTTDKPWGSQNHALYVGFAWYRKHLDLKQADGADPNFALLFPLVDDIYEIYWNGKLVGTYGKVPPGPNSDYHPTQQTSGIGPAREGVLAVRDYKSPLLSFDVADIGGFEQVPLIGSPAAIAAAKTLDDYAWMRSNQFTFCLNVLYTLVALLGLIVWYRIGHNSCCLRSPPSVVATCSWPYLDFVLPFPAFRH